MFNEANQHFFGLIISPYYSVSSDSAPHLNALPKLRVFHTVKDSGSGRIVPYELQINIIPQRKLLHSLLLDSILTLK
jgi:hypothetical protein